MKNILKIGGLIVLLLSLSVKVDACWPYGMLDWYGDPDDSWTNGGSGSSGNSNNLPVSIVTGNISQDQNYIITATPYKAVSGGSLDNTNSNITIQYYDGLGRPVEQVQSGITPNHNDLVTYQEYDAFGRESNSWLPAVASGNNVAFIPFETFMSKSADTYNNTSNNVSADVSPYAYPVYEASPLNRALEQYGPGQDWHLNSKSVSTDYQTNSGFSGALSCALFTVTGTGVNINVNKIKFYDNGQLYVTKTTDEDGKYNYQFKDKLGRVVLTRHGLDCDTYYVYDDFGNLCFVIPPMASRELAIANNNTSYNETYGTIKQYAYIYKYDNRNRCIWKKLPGCEPIYYVYDNADRLIFTQDGENRKAGLWRFSIPDLFGRMALTGTCSNTFDYTANPLGTTVVKGVYNTSRTNLGNSYTISGITLSTPVILIANFYDNYNFMGIMEAPNNSNTQYNAEDGHNDRYTGSYNGMLTGTVTAQLAPNGTVPSTYLYSIKYYDYKGRLIQTKNNNLLLGGLEKEYITYDFAGQPTGKKHIHSVIGKDSQTEVYVYQYDHAERLMKETHQLNAGPITTIAENTYDELGRLKTNKKGGLANTNATYAYNIRSWVKSITNPSFTENLYYNEPYAYNNKTYNGNISAISWKMSGDANTHGYTFHYDALSQLGIACYYLNEVETYGNPCYYSNYTYDKQGNMLTLFRFGKTSASTYGIIDNLTMAYTGNQLTKVEDAAPDVLIAESADFKNYANKAVEYEYNTNGAMTQDLNEGISDIQYNLLNLPRLIDIKSPVAEARNEYTYSASGQKLKVAQKWNPYYSTAPVIGSTVSSGSLLRSKTTDYVGNMIYEDGGLKRILIDGGYIESGVYYYFVTDHLGNNRLLINPGGSVVQKNNYYPFGMAFAETSATEQGKQPYKFGGKELDLMNGLNLYDYSARFYDPAVGRPITMDPLCEKDYPVSPYAWCANNPVNNVDPTGKEIIFLIKTINGTGRYQYMADGNLKSVSTGKVYSGSSVGGNAGRVIDGYTKMLNSGDKNYVNQVTTLIKSKNVHEIDVTVFYDGHSEVVAGSGTTSISEAESKAKKGEGVGTTTTYGDLSKKELENSDVGKTNYTTVAHEVQHQYDYDQGNMKDDFDKNGNHIQGQKSPAEQRAMKNEEKAREKEDLKQRKIY